MWYKASAPGSLMLLGEHAVLHGKQALVCAVDKRMTVTLAPREDKEIHLHSPRLGEWSTTINELAVAQPFTFITGCLYRFRRYLKQGCDITINAEFCAQVGLGSSAAVTVATLAVLKKWLNAPIDLLRHSREVIRLVQDGLGSGADAAASILGGVVAYRSLPQRAEKLSVSFPLTVVYSGYKTPTPEVIKIVHEHFVKTPALYKTLCNAIHDCAGEGLSAIREGDWARLGKAMDVQQGLMQSLNVSTPELDNLVLQLRQSQNMLGAKISGSGLGDCVIGLGETDLNNPQQIKVKVEVEGVKVEEGGLHE